MQITETMMSDHVFFGILHKLYISPTQKFKVLGKYNEHLALVNKLFLHIHWSDSMLLPTDLRMRAFDILFLTISLCKHKKIERLRFCLLVRLYFPCCY